MIKRKAQIFNPEGGDGRNGEEFLQSPEFSNKHARSLTDRPTFAPCLFSHSGERRISVVDSE